MSLPQSILIYRQLLQWLGGIGIIVVAVAILPMLGVGGMQLYKAETPGPSKRQQAHPPDHRNRQGPVCRLPGTHAGLRGLLLRGGHVGFDAIAHSFSTVSLAGFSTHDASLGFFQSDAVLVVASVFMVISSINFGLHFLAWRRKSVWHLSQGFRNPFLCHARCSICIFITVFGLIVWNIHGHRRKYAFCTVYFQVMSIITTTGYSTENLAAWPIALPIMAIFFSCMGGCVGSTTGGIKAMRVMLDLQAGRAGDEATGAPAGGDPAEGRRPPCRGDRGQRSVEFFCGLHLAYIVLLLMLMLTGLDFTTAFSAVAATLNNLGMGIAGVASGFGDLSEPTKAILCFAMLLGRLEIFTLLVLFTPAFWRI